MSNLLAVFLASALILLSACSGESTPTPIPAQSWNEMDVRIQTRPDPPFVGKAEVVVIVTGARGRPVHDLIVSVRADDASAWVQTIQDGHIGVYRRGVSLGFRENAALQVRLQQGEKSHVLFFPLKLIVE